MFKAYNLCALREKVAELQWARAAQSWACVVRAPVLICTWRYCGYPVCPSYCHLGVIRRIEQSCRCPVDATQDVMLTYNT
jgi:hypothetical protein